MPHFGTPDELASPVLGGVTRARAPEVAKLVFVGGTGRSGTHVLSRLIGRHNRYGLVPVEVRFHTDPDGFPGLLAGEVTPEAFIRRMRGFWWRGFQTRRFRGMYRFVDRERYDAAVARFEADHDDLEAACRRLFYDLLWFRIENQINLWLGLLIRTKCIMEQMVQDFAVQLSHAFVIGHERLHRVLIRVIFVIQTQSELL